MNRFLFQSILIIVSWIFSSCEKELDFKYHYIEPLTVIEGELTQEGLRVGLTLTTPMGEPMNRTLLTDAEVILTDLTSGISEDIYPDVNGYYSSGQGGIVGHDYLLSVSRNGNIWTSRTTMYPPVEIVSINFSWIKMPYDFVSALQVLYTDDPGSKGECFWLKIFRNGEIYSWAEQEDRSSEDGLMSYVSMMSRQDTSEEDEGDVIVDGDTITVKVYRISPTMRTYIEAIGNDSSGPALFTGENVLGYFLASSPISQSVVYRPDEFPYWK